VLFLLSAIIVNAVLNGLPTVGVVQGLAPALRGESTPAASARAPEVRFLSHHAFGLIVGSALESIAVVVLTFALLFVLGAARFRKPDDSPLARTLVIAGGAGLAIFGVAVQAIRAVRTHDFAIGHDFSEHAVEAALTKGTLNVVVGYLGLLAPLVLTIGMIMVIIQATRVGLLTRWLRGLGIAAAIVMLPLFAGVFYLQLVPAAWLVAMGLLFMGRLPGGELEAWASGRSQPWPSQAEMRAQTLAERDRRRAGASASKRRKPPEPEPAPVDGRDGGPPAAERPAELEPAEPMPATSHARSKKRRRKRR
jgi:hypothetical protein